MARPSLAEQIAKAAAAGDMEKVKELADRLAKPKPKPKPKTKRPKQLEVEVPDDSDLVTDTVPGNDYMAPSRAKNKQQVHTDEDGKRHVVSRIVPFKVIKNRKNEWEDTKEEGMNDVEFDKKVHKKKNKRTHRETVTKITVICNRCNQKYKKWPGEILHSNWICDECLTNKSLRD